MKKLLFVLLLCASSFTFANEGWYIGVGTGRSTLKYDSQAYLNKAIKDQGYQIPVDVLDKQGYPLTFTNDFTSITSEVLVGYRFSQRWSVEGVYGTLGTFRVNGDFHFHVSGTQLPSSGYPIDSFANADAVGTASLTKTDFMSVSALYTITDKQLIEPYIRFGLGYLTGTLETYYNYSYSYGANSNGQPAYNPPGFSDKQFQSESYGVPIVIVGFGLRVNVNEKTEMRFEYQRLGGIVKEPNIETYTIQLVRLF